MAKLFEETNYACSKCDKGYFNVICDTVIRRDPPDMSVDDCKRVEAVAVNRIYRYVCVGCGEPLVRGGR